MKLKSKHEKTVDWLVERLFNVGRYTFVQSDIEYNRRGYIGQVDVLSYDKHKDTYYFWEVKSSYSRKTYRTAYKQYVKYCNAHPGKRIRGIMVTPKRIRKLTDYIG